MAGGGWIKMEKDLLTDPRVTNFIGNAPAFQCVTQVLGCLAHLWMIADAHIGDDDILALGANQIDHILRAEGFCQLCPQDWLQVLDSNHVKLPGFHAHNGPQAKARALTARRVSKHRNDVNDKPLQREIISNAPPLPDKTETRQDKTSLEGAGGAAPRAKKTAAQNNRGTRLPEAWPLTPALKDFAESMGLQNVQRVFDDFCDYWHSVPGVRALKTNWSVTWSRWCRNQLDRQGQVPPRPNGHGPNANRDVAAWAEARALAKAIGFRDPGAQESVGAYYTAAKLARDRPPAMTLAQLQARAHR